MEETTLPPNLPLADKTNVEDQVVLKDTHKILNSLISELPEIHRLALTLRYHENMSYDQIALALDQPLGTVKSKIYRARNMLRQKMQECELLEV